MVRELCVECIDGMHIIVKGCHMPIGVSKVPFTSKAILNTLKKVGETKQALTIAYYFGMKEQIAYFSHKFDATQNKNHGYTVSLCRKCDKAGETIKGEDECLVCTNPAKLTKKHREHAMREAFKQDKLKPRRHYLVREYVAGRLGWNASRVSRYIARNKYIRGLSGACESLQEFRQRIPDNTPVIEYATKVEEYMNILKYPTTWEWPLPECFDVMFKAGDPKITRNIRIRCCDGIELDIPDCNSMLPQQQLVNVPFRASTVIQVLKGNFTKAKPAMQVAGVFGWFQVCEARQSALPRSPAKPVHPNEVPASPCEVLDIQNFYYENDEVF